VQKGRPTLWHDQQLDRNCNNLQTTDDFELTDPAFAELVRDLGYSEIRYVDCGPWYTKAKYEQPLEHPDAGVEERMGAQ